MDVQKYIKRLKFARADWSRNIGDFHSKEDALNFLNAREFFFGDPFVVKYTENGETKLMLAIGKSENPEITADTTEVTGGVGPDAYELFDMNEFREAIEELKDTTSGLTEDVREIYDIIENLTGSTADLLEITGEGWTDSPTNVTLTDRIKRDEELMKIVWEFNHGGSGVYEPRFNDVPIEIDYDATHNRIRLVAGEAATEYIQLNGAAEVFTRIEYIPELEVIRFWYMPSGNPDPQEEYFDIDVHALIEEWETEDTDTVKLTRERVVAGKDKLTADVKISADGDNMLTVVSDGLKVEDVRPAIQEIQEHVTESDEVTAIALNRLAEAIASNVGGLEQERNERITGDAELNERIDEVNEKVDELESVVTEEQEVTAIALDRLAEGVSNNANNIAALQEGADEFGQALEQERNERIAGDMAAQGRCQMIQDQLDDEKGYRKAIKLVEISHDKFAELGLGDNVRDAYFVTYHKPNSTEPYELPQTGDAIVKVYKDSVIYKIVFGHVGDQITSPTDPTIIDGTGSTAIDVIYFDANGNYALTTTPFDMADALAELEAEFDEAQEVTAIALNHLAEALDNLSGETRYAMGFLFDRVMELSEDFDESEEVTSLALNRLAEGVVTAKSEVQLEEGTRHITLNKTYGDDGHEIYVIGEYHITSKKDFDDLKRDVDDLESRADNTDAFLGNIKDILNTEDDGHLTTRFTGAHTATASTYYDAINALDNAVTGAEQATRSLGNSYELEYTKDGENAEIALKWAVDGVDHVSRINVSDFVKDSFLENVNIQTGDDGKQYLVFTFKTYDGQPYPIWVPLASLAAIYKDGDGIDREALENDQVIKIKLDEVASKNWLAVSANGLRVTGVTEAIEEAVAGEAAAREAADNELRELINNEISARTEADNELNERITELSASTDSKFEEITEIIHEVTGETLNEYVRKDEVEDHLDSGSTLPVQNKVVTKALDDLMEDVQEIIESMTAITANTIEVNEITGGTAHFSGLTANTIYANEYQNLPTATTEQFGVVILDDHLDSASTNPVENKAITKVILENEEAVAAALNDLKHTKADTTAVTAADEYLQEQIDNITAGGLTGVVTAGTGNVVTKIEKDGNNVKATLGATMLEKSAFDTYTANTKNEFITSAITANTEYVEHLTANTINTTAITANTEVVSAITANTEYVEHLTANTINATAVTATTVSATTYNNLPTASTTNYGMVILDDHLDSGSTNAVMNSAITMVILENEETVAAALNDLETRKANKTDVNNALDNHETRITNLEDAIETIEGGGLTGVTTTGTGNVITGLTKSGNSVVGHLGTITADDRVLNTTFNTYTASTQTTMTGKADKTYVDSNFFHSAEYYSSGSTHEIRFKDASGNTISTVNADDFIKDGMVDNVQISGSSLVITFNTDSGKSPISIPLVNIFNPDNYYNKTQVDNLLAGKSNTGHTHTAAELPTASTTNLGIVKVDDALSTGSTNPVQNKVITQTILDNELVVAAALNDLNNRKANIEDIPVTISDLSDGGDVAMKTDLSGFLPLSGGTMTGNISGSTGNAIYMPGGFFQTSDERLKIFMGDVDNALEKAKQIPTKYFYWKDRYDGPREIGTSAQRVQELFPEIVSGDDKLSVDYSKLAIVALAAVKELSAKVDELQREIDELKK